MHYKEQIVDSVRCLVGTGEGQVNHVYLSIRGVYVKDTFTDGVFTERSEHEFKVDALGVESAEEE
jgi:hypothetical protein